MFRLTKGAKKGNLVIGNGDKKLGDYRLLIQFKVKQPNHCKSEEQAMLMVLVTPRGIYGFDVMIKI